MIDITINEREFCGAIDTWLLKTKRNLELTVQDAAIGLAERIVNKTPVDTGRLRGAWKAGPDYIPKSPLGDRQRRIRSERTGKLMAPGRSIYDKSGKQTLAQIRSNIRKIKWPKSGDWSCWIWNNTRYGPYVEYGTSKMAPRAMVRRSMVEWPSIVNEVVAGRRVR